MKELYHNYKNNGFVVIPNLFDESKINDLLAETLRLCREEGSKLPKIGSGVIAYMETGIVAMGWSGLWRQFFNGLIIILALLGHRFHGNRIR